VVAFFLFSISQSINCPVYSQIKHLQEESQSSSCSSSVFSLLCLTTTIRPCCLVHNQHDSITAYHTPHDDHSSRPSNHNWLLNASNTLNTNQPCRQARPTAPTARTRVPTHPVPRHPPHVCRQLLSNQQSDMTLTCLQRTPLLPRAFTQTPVARHAARRTANPSSTTVGARSTTRIRRRPRRTGDTTTRQDDGCRSW
jgi:hypothetical protein